MHGKCRGGSGLTLRGQALSRLSRTLSHTTTNLAPFLPLPPRLGLSRQDTGSEFAWLDSTAVAQGVEPGSAYPHWAWLQPQLAAAPAHDCVAAWQGYQYERFLGEGDNTNQVGVLWQLCWCLASWRSTCSTLAAHCSTLHAIGPAHLWPF